MASILHLALLFFIGTSVVALFAVPVLLYERRRIYNVIVDYRLQLISARYGNG